MENKKATQEEIQLKMLLIGEQAVGKSSLINQYVEGKFELNLLCAAGLDLKKKMITVNNKQVKLMIYDSAGHERYRGLAKNQLHTTKGILIVYDVTERSSFEALNFWLKSYKENAESGSVCLVIGNKIDLNEKRVVSIEEGKNIAKEYGVHFIETSATIKYSRKSIENVAVLLFKALCIPKEISALIAKPKITAFIP